MSPATFHFSYPSNSTVRDPSAGVDTSTQNPSLDADYFWKDTKGVLGWLKYYSGFDGPHSVLGGLVTAVEKRTVHVSGDALGVADRDVDVWVVTWYFGDDPTTGDPIYGSTKMMDDGDSYSYTQTGWTCNDVGGGPPRRENSYPHGCINLNRPTIRLGSLTADETFEVVTIGCTFPLDIWTVPDTVTLDDILLDRGRDPADCLDRPACAMVYALFPETSEYDRGLVRPG